MIMGYYHTGVICKTNYYEFLESGNRMYIFNKFFTRLFIFCNTKVSKFKFD